MKIIFNAIILSFLMTTVSLASPSINLYFEQIKNNPEQLLIFLDKMPKGGDLHIHAGGASMAENMIQYAMPDSLCINQKNYAVSLDKHCRASYLLSHSPQNTFLYNSLIDAWSMRDFHLGKESGHDHFFATFGKYLPIVSMHSGEILAEIVERAANQNELYIELMVTPDNNESGMLGKKIGWDPNLAHLRQKLLENGLDPIVKKISHQLNLDEAKRDQVLQCGTAKAEKGCDMTVRYLYQILREQPPENVFAQLLAGFEVANQDKRVVGINMVQPEDGYISMRDYKLHMEMVNFLHSLYPGVSISLHAGELNDQLVPKTGLRNHIKEAIEIAHAKRIGHGVDIAQEENAKQLLKEMAQKNILVEINLTSNAEILGIKGKNHPLPLYMRYHVPVAISTDDEAVLRTSLTKEYQRAILSYHFDYATLKNVVRNSIAYSFLPGKNLWDSNYHQITTECAKDIPGQEKLSLSCQTFLNSNEKAKVQWDLEKRFALFERDYH